RTVRLAAPRSFCAGVERAIDIVERALDRYGAPIFVRRQIVHNAHIVAALERRGAVFVDELEQVPDGARVIFAAHGVAPQVRGGRETVAGAETERGVEPANEGDRGTYANGRRRRRAWEGRSGSPPACASAFRRWSHRAATTSATPRATARLLSAR